MTLGRDICGRSENPHARSGRKSGRTLVPAFRKSWTPGKPHGTKRYSYFWNAADTVRKRITPFPTVPCPATHGKIAGHLCVVSEETERVIGERRLRTLRSLATESNRNNHRGKTSCTLSLAASAKIKRTYRLRSPISSPETESSPSSRAELEFPMTIQPRLK